MPEPRESRVRIPIRWRDLDVLGHVNQSVYHELLEEGRAGVLGRLDENAFPLVLVHIDIDYLAEVRKDHDWVEVTSRVDHIGTKSVRLAERIERSDGVVATEGHAVLVAWDMSSRTSRALTDRERSALSGV
jgi:acyl-CoA thioester hydrolase